jgi:hypothetical protein
MLDVVADRIVMVFLTQPTVVDRTISMRAVQVRHQLTT